MKTPPYYVTGMRPILFDVRAQHFRFITPLYYI